MQSTTDMDIASRTALSGFFRRARLLRNLTLRQFIRVCLAPVLLMTIPQNIAAQEIEDHTEGSGPWTPAYPFLDTTCAIYRQYQDGTIITVLKNKNGTTKINFGAAKGSLKDSRRYYARGRDYVFVHIGGWSRISVNESDDEITAEMPSEFDKMFRVGYFVGIFHGTRNLLGTFRLDGSADALDDLLSCAEKLQVR